MNLDFSAIKESKNLLAFSAGVDSTALFFLLLEKNIPFDIAIVNYNIRIQSLDEVAYAKELASKYNKQIFIKDVKLESTSNFEKTARDIRYAFFEEIISKEKYENLITAHQLNDKLEWFLMQLTKGAGISELLGLQKFQEKNGYFVSRPLLDISKNDLLNYLKEQNIKYFIDNSNYDEKYKRNYFRHNFSDELIANFQNGIKNSFTYLQSDLNSMEIDFKPIYENNKLEIFKNLGDDNLNIKIIDKSLKKRGFLISSAQREEILKQKSIVVSHKISVNIEDKYIWISPFSSITMEKRFKELCRTKKIPQNIRAYLFEKNIDLKELIF